MKRSHIFLCSIGAALAAVVIGACSAAPRNRTFDDDGSGGDGSTGTDTSSSGTFSGVGGGFNPSGGSGGGVPGCESPPDADMDGDGFSRNQGDCNDCDPNSNPGSVEVINDDPMAPKSDEDCSGVADDVMVSCDTGIAVGDPDPMSGAKAIDLCRVATAADKKWGVLEASYVRADGTKAGSTLHNGVIDKFGSNVKVQGGERMMLLSSGHARLPGDPDECGSQTCSVNSAGSAPPGFPADVPGCQGLQNINDDVGLELKIRSPKNATGYQFLFKFYSFEFPEYVCTSYNDQFIALVSPPPMGSINGNISFDSKTNPVSVNIAFFDVCDPAGITNFASVCSFDFLANCPPPPNPYCPSGTAELSGTGFDTWGDAGGTSWLKTQAPIKGGDEMTIRFAIWDTGDTALDSSVLVDQFGWIANGGTVSVGTEPIVPN